MPIILGHQIRGPHPSGHRSRSPRTPTISPRNIDGIPSGCNRNNPELMDPALSIIRKQTVKRRALPLASGSAYCPISFRYGRTRFALMSPANAILERCHITRAKPLGVFLDLPLPFHRHPPKQLRDRQIGRTINRRHRSYPRNRNT